MSKTKQGGKTRQESPRAGKRLGVKIFGGQPVKVGQIILRQRGTKVHPGAGAGMGRDHTLFAMTNGLVRFLTKRGRKFVGVTG